MHMYLASRGQKDKVDNFINDLQAINLHYGSPNEKGHRMIVQLGVHPIELWELTFPKEHFETILNTIAPGFDNTKVRQREMKILQKFRGLVSGSVIPRVNLTGKKRIIVRNAAVSVYPFATKEDAVWTDAPTETLDNGQRIPKELIGHERI